MAKERLTLEERTMVIEVARKAYMEIYTSIMQGKIEYRNVFIKPAERYKKTAENLERKGFFERVGRNKYSPTDKALEFFQDI